MAGTPRGDIDAVAIRRASPDDIHLAVEILEESIAWTLSIGVTSWEPGSFANLAGRGRARLREAVADGCLYLVWSNGKPAATFSLLNCDPLFWPAADNEALYLHRFAVRRTAAGLGRLALSWMIGETRRRGRSRLRLDTTAKNRHLRAYYEAAGFILQGETIVEGERFALYELQIPDH